MGGLVSKVTMLPVAPGYPQFEVALASLGDIGPCVRGLGAADGLSHLRGQLDGAGGGVDADRAAVIAVAEALERYSSCVQDPAQFIVASAEELGDEGLDLDTVPRCSESELSHPLCPVVQPSLTEPIRWVRGVSLTRRKLIWVPAALVYLQLPEPTSAERFTLPISTGCAAQRSYPEAVRSALCEVIERDAISLTWLLRLRLPRIDVDEPDDELLRSLRKVEDRPTQIHLFDATTDVGVPVVYALEVAPHDTTCAVVVACSADLDPRRAVAKVLREASSTRIGLSGPRSAPEDPDQFISAFDGAHYMGDPTRLHAFDFLLNSSEHRRLSEMPHPATGNAAEQLRWLLDQLEGLGMEAVAVDLTTDEGERAGMRVVRVVVPQLQPLSFSHRARYLGHPRLRLVSEQVTGVPGIKPVINSWPQPFA